MLFTVIETRIKPDRPATSRERHAETPSVADRCPPISAACPSHASQTAWVGHVYAVPFMSSCFCVASSGLSHQFPQQRCCRLQCLGFLQVKRKQYARLRDGAQPSPACSLRKRTWRQGRELPRSYRREPAIGQPGHNSSCLCLCCCVCMRRLERQAGAQQQTTRNDPASPSGIFQCVPPLPASCLLMAECRELHFFFAAVCTLCDLCNTAPVALSCAGSRTGMR